MIALRLATVEDVPLIRELADEIWRAVYPGVISIEQIEFMIDWMYAAEKLKNDIAEGEIRFWIFDLADEPVGFASIGPGEAELELHLHKLYLKPTLHGRGFGSAALQQLLTESRSLEADEISLRVNRANEPAIRCYERNGFTREREICDDIGGGFVMDDYWMVRKLDT
ncbi:MAG: RimJ/RimL family protein N-acetyltransferase [Verrucomicrobiales bacterium]